MSTNTLETWIKRRDAQKRYVEKQQDRSYSLLTTSLKVSDKKLLLDLKHRLTMLALEGIHDVIQ